MVLWEHDTRLASSLRDLPRALRPSTLSAGLVAATIGVSGPPLLVYQAGLRAGYAPQELGSWFFAIFCGGGLFTLLLALAYRQPMTGAFSIAGAALLLQVLPQFGLHQAVGAYLLAGALITALAASGWFERLMGLVPQEIVLAMLAGVLLRFGVDLFPQLVQAPLLVGGTLAAYLLGHVLPRGIPPVALALGVGVALAFALHAVHPHAPDAQPVTWALTLPRFYGPEFSLNGFLSLSLPLVLLALSSQNATGIGVLWAQGYRAPLHAITWATGLLSLLTGAMAGHGVNLATPMTALCADPSAHPDPELRYGAAVVTGVVWIACGLLGLTMVGVIAFLPAGLILTVAGLGLLPVILQSLQRAFGANRHRYGCVFALLIAASNATWLGIGAAFWALLLAAPVSLILDRDWHLRQT